MANWEITTANNSLEFDTTQAQYNRCEQVDENHFINFWYGVDNDAFTQIFEVNTATWAVTTAAAWLEFNNSYQQGGVEKIDTNHFIDVFSGLASDGYAQVVEVDTSTWVVTTASAVFEWRITDAYYIHTVKVDDNHIMVMHADAAMNGVSQILEINTSNWVVTTAGDPFQFDASGQYLGGDTMPVDENHFINVFSGAGDDGFAVILEVNTSTWAISTAAAPLEYDTARGNYPTIGQVDTNHFVTFYRGTAGDDGIAQVLEVNTSTWAITTTNTPLEYDTTDFYGGHNTKIDTNHFVLFWTGAGEDGFAQTFEVNTTTWAVTTAAASLEYDTQNGINPASFLIDESHIINFWNGSADKDGFVQVFEVDVPTVLPIKINIADAWIDIDSMKINIGDDWKDVVRVQQNIGDVWKDVFDNS